MLIVRQMSSARSRRSVLKKFGRSWEYDAGSSQGGGCKMFANSAQPNSQDCSTEMNILHNYTGSRSYIEVQDQTEDENPRAPEPMSKRRKQSAGNNRISQKSKENRYVGATKTRNPYLMLSGLVDQLDGKHGASTFVLPTRQKTQAIDFVE